MLYLMSPLALTNCRFQAGAIRRRNRLPKLRSRPSLLPLPLVAWLVLLSATSPAQTPVALAIDELTLSATDGGESVARPFSSGETVFVRFTVTGARSAKADDDSDPRVRLRYSFTLTDAAGLPLAKPSAGEVVADLAPEDKQWKPKVFAELELPTGLVRGQAKLVIELEDQVASAKTARQTEIPLAGPAIPEDAPLSANDFGFYRQEDAPQPVITPAYRPGDTIWARFTIIGFARGDGNRYDIAYGLEAFNAAGASMFRQEVAAEQTGESAYPRRYLPSVLSLQLGKDLAPGAYRIQLLLHDRISDRHVSSDHRFTVE